MAEKVGEIYYDVTLDTGKFISKQREVQRLAEQTGQSLENSGRGGARGMDAATKSANALTASLRQVAAAASMYSSASYLIAQSDAYTKLTAQLKLATANTAQLATAQAAVIAIAQESQVDLSGVGMLYARITSSTKELGLSQETVGNITRSVALALKVSGSSAAESASATLQLSQAFASGTLRGDEFNSVNEAAPRLMLALADGIGIPVGALRKMAEAGLITSEVMAKALPSALASLEKEAKQIQTISGAFQQLKNEATLFIGQTSEQSGAVKLLTGTIGLLADNLTLLAGVMGTVAAVKLAVYLQGVATSAMQSIASNSALTASTLATAQANATASASTLALAAARVNELRASVASASGATALAITVNGLVPAQARAAAAAEAHAASLVALSVAQRAASTTATILSGSMRLLGGPIGVITTILGLGATAWSIWGDSAESASKQASDAVKESHDQVVRRLDEQNKKLRERIALAKQGNKAAAAEGGPEAERLAGLLSNINDIKSKGAAATDTERRDLIELEGQYLELNATLRTRRDLDKEIKDIGEAKSATEWMKKYATETEKANAEVAKAKKELGSAFTPELEQRIRGKIDKPKKEKKPFDQAKYLADQQAKAASAWDKIDIDEAESVRKNDAHLKAKEISEATHSASLKAIREEAAKNRRELSQSELDRLVQDIMTEERLQDEANARRRQKEEQQARAEMEARQLIADAAGDPVEKIRLEEEAKLAAQQAAYDQQLISLQMFEDAKSAIQSKARADEQAIQEANNVMSVQLAGKMADDVFSVLTKAGKDRTALGKALFLASKALAVAEIIINTEVAATKAGAQLGIFGIPMATMIRAQGYASAGMVAGMAVADAVGGRAYGGPVSADSLYRVNERGAPEMFTAANGSQYMMPTANGRVTAADKVGGGSPVVNVVVNNTAPGTTATATYDDQSRTVSIAVTEVANQIRTNTGPVWSAMRGATNVQARM